jgi:glycosyltransferase involved in cell wall biosynthesis
MPQSDVSAHPYQHRRAPVSLLSQDVIVYFNGTFMQRSNGAHTRADACLRFLLRHFERVIVYSFRNHPTCPWTDDLVQRFAAEYPRARLVLEQRSPCLVAMTRLKNVLTAFLPSLARQIIRLSLPGAAPSHRSLLNEHPRAVLIVNYVDGLTQLNGIPHRQVVVETHDIKFVNYRFQAHRPATALRSILKFRSEIALLSTAQAVIAISPTEAHFFRMLVDNAEVLYIPDFNQDGKVQEAEREDSEDFLYDLVFVGSDNILNVEGLIGFLEDNMRWLAKYRIAVCGKVCQQAGVMKIVKRHPNVSLLGFVEDMDQVYRHSKAAVSPVLGTGLKIKIVDALAKGKPVFASQSSFAGLPPGYEGCVFPIEQRVMGRILDRAECRRAAVRESRAYFASFGERGDREHLLGLFSDQQAATQASLSRNVTPAIQRRGLDARSEYLKCD